MNSKILYSCSMTSSLEAVPNLTSCTVIFFTILQGCPENELKNTTRFKTWMEMVGSQFEYGAKLNGKNVSLDDCFGKSEVGDKAVEDRAGHLETLREMFPGGQVFDAKTLVKKLNEGFEDYKKSPLINIETDGVIELRALCTGETASHPSAKKANIELKKMKGAPTITATESGVIVLTLWHDMDAHTHRETFQVTTSDR